MLIDNFSLSAFYVCVYIILHRVVKFRTISESLQKNGKHGVGICDIMSVNEQEQAQLVHSEWRMSITIAAYAAVSTEDANRDIINIKTKTGNKGKEKS